MLRNNDVMIITGSSLFIMFGEKRIVFNSFNMMKVPFSILHKLRQNGFWWDISKFQIDLLTISYRKYGLKWSNNRLANNQLFLRQ